MIAICMPSRGLIHSRTIEALLANTQGLKVNYYFSHDLPIPECFNYVCERALADSNNKYILILEEDVVLPDMGIYNMRMALIDYDIAYYDYMLKDGRNSSAVIEGTNYISTGCTMFTHDALLQLMPFTSKYQYHSKTRELLQELTIEQQHKIYGYHDEHMSLQIKELGLTAINLGTLAKHYKVEAYGEQNVNAGCHDIYEC